MVGPSVEPANVRMRNSETQDGPIIWAFADVQGMGPSQPVVRIPLPFVPHIALLNHISGVWLLGATWFIYFFIFFAI